jgi:hypothetical protein
MRRRDLAGLLLEIGDGFHSRIYATRRNPARGTSPISAGVLSLERGTNGDAVAEETLPNCGPLGDWLFLGG